MAGDPLLGLVALCGSCGPFGPLPVDGFGHLGKFRAACLELVRQLFQPTPTGNHTGTRRRSTTDPHPARSDPGTLARHQRLAGTEAGTRRQRRIEVGDAAHTAQQRRHRRL